MNIDPYDRCCNNCALQINNEKIEELCQDRSEIMLLTDQIDDCWIPINCLLVLDEQK